MMPGWEDKTHRMAVKMHTCALQIDPSQPEAEAKADLIQVGGR